MLNELKETANITQTENGAKAYRSTRSACLNFFVACGAMRGIDRTAVLKCFARAYVEDANLAMRSLFYARDVRGGLGERELFRDIVRYTARFRPESILKNLALIPEYGRYDDLLVLLGTPCAAAPKAGSVFSGSAALKPRCAQRRGYGIRASGNTTEAPPLR